MLNCTFVNFILQNCQKRVLKRYKLGKNAQNCMLKIVNHKFQNEKIFDGGKRSVCNAYFCTPATPQTFKVLIFNHL